MNIIIENLETGVRYDQFTCPQPITAEAARAYHRGQRTGIVYGNGHRWQWHDETPHEDDILIELTRDGVVEDDHDPCDRLGSVADLCGPPAESMRATG